MKRNRILALLTCLFALMTVWAIAEGARPLTGFDAVIARHTDALHDQGRAIFRNDTFGDEAFWGDTLQLHKAIAGAKLGGVGPGVSPATALAVGLKVDSDALPGSLVAQLREGKVNLNDPATTLSL